MAKLTGDQIEKLIEAISGNVWISIALGHFGIEKPEIDDLEKKHRGDVRAVSRDLITIWKNKPSNEDNQVKVRNTFQL